MKIHIFQHAHYEDPGNIVDIIKNGDHKISTTKFYEQFSLPNIDNIDFLIIMGAPMSVHDVVDYPWLMDEKKFILKAIRLGKKVLGICFGSQLIADVLGAKVYANSQKEIGWFEIKKDPKNSSLYFSNYEETNVAFHWHGDTYDLPYGAQPIFSSEATKNQGFTYKDNVVALQFHWEVKKENALALIKHSGNDLLPGSYIQNEFEILDNTNGFSANFESMKTLLSNMGLLY